jgi:circadian clock protein KaiC
MQTREASNNAMNRVSTGIRGLNEILRGGLIARRSYMIRGGPGSGKTILGLHFLNQGVLENETALLVTFGESEAELRQNGAPLGFAMDRIAFLDLSPDSSYFASAQGYDIFSPSEVEREPVTRRIREEVSARKPSRIFIDGLTQLRYLTANTYQFRKEVLACLRYLCETGATVLFSSESNEAPDEDLQFIADAVIDLRFSDEQRSAAVLKFRGSDFRSGRHTLRLSDEGMKIFPRLFPEDFRVDFVPEALPFGVAELDAMTHGGLERGTITIITGPSGVGKSTIAMQFVVAAAERGECPVVYLFEEGLESLMNRCEAIGIPVHAAVDSGKLSIVHVEPLRYTADEFALMVREQVEHGRSRVVMIDSISGYRLSLHDQDLIAHMHALAKYLQNMGVAILLINEVEAITGDFRITDVGVSYMSDNIIFLRYLEMRGEMSKALGVLKKRISDFEKTLREVTITSEGIRIGPQLSTLRGILSGTPEWVDPQS